jgi:hypothetical protein
MVLKQDKHKQACQQEYYLPDHIIIQWLINSGGVLADIE